MTRKTFTFRLPPDLAETLEAATDTKKNPYAPRPSQIVINGLRAELDRIAATGPKMKTKK